MNHLSQQFGKKRPELPLFNLIGLCHHFEVAKNRSSVNVKTERFLSIERGANFDRSQLVRASIVLCILDEDLIKHGWPEDFW